MNVSTPRIVGRGDLAQERVIFTANEECDLSAFILIDSQYIEGSTISAGSQLAYWFGGKAVSAGDSVIVYSRTGVDSTRVRDDGFKNHFFFRHLDYSVYADQRSCVVVAELNDWLTSHRILGGSVG